MLGGAKCKKNAILRLDPVVWTNFWKLGQAAAETDRNLQNRYGQESENLGILGSDILVKCQGSCPPAEIWMCFRFFTGSLTDSAPESQSGRSPDAKVTFWDVLLSCQSTSFINSGMRLTSSHLSLSSYHHLLAL